MRLRSSPDNPSSLQDEAGAMPDAAMAEDDIALSARCWRMSMLEGERWKKFNEQCDGAEEWSSMCTDIKFGLIHFNYPADAKEM